MVEYGCLPDMCRALLLLSGMEHQVKQEIGENVVSVIWHYAGFVQKCSTENRYHPADDLLCSLSGI